jgi:hypothetical protein
MPKSPQSRRATNQTRDELGRWCSQEALVAVNFEEPSSPGAIRRRGSFIVAPSSPRTSRRWPTRKAPASPVKRTPGGGAVQEGARRGRGTDLSEPSEWKEVPIIELDDSTSSSDGDIDFMATAPHDPMVRFPCLSILGCSSCYLISFDTLIARLLVDVYMCC